VEGLGVGCLQVRLADSSNHDLGLRDLDPRQDRVEDLDALLRRPLRKMPFGREELLAVELEVVLVAGGGAILTSGIANVLVKGAHLRLLDRHGQDEVNGLLSIVEIATGIAGLVHVGEPHRLHPFLPELFNCPQSCGRSLMRGQTI